MYYITYTHPTKKAKTYIHKKHDRVTLDVQRRMKEAGYKLASTVGIPNETISFIKAWKEKRLDNKPFSCCTIITKRKGDVKMLKNFFIGTPHEFQIYTHKKPCFRYDNSIHEIGVFPYCLMLGWITICWGTWEGDNENEN